MTRVLGICAVLLAALLGMGSGDAGAAALPDPPSPPTLLESAALRLGSGAVLTLDADGAPVAIHSIATDGTAITVCLDVEIGDLASDGWLGMERVQEGVRAALAPLAWRALSVQAFDVEGGTCRPLSDFAPTTRPNPVVVEEAADRANLAQVLAEQPAALRPDAAAAYPASLAGKTVYISAGHGWFWNGSAWRTQRPPYQGFIEDHNNAEVVTQYLIPYLENAGATVVPVRERDWNSSAALTDNDSGYPRYAETGAWFTGSSGSGYAGGSYRAVGATWGPPTATATWTLNVPAPGNYAVYAWVFPGPNRVPDAHYTVHHAGGSTDILLDQRIFPNTWRYLGTFPFYAGDATVVLDNVTHAAPQSFTYAAIADAIRIGGGTFDSLTGLPLLTAATSYAGSAPPSSAPYKPWWETSTFYWSQHVGLNPNDWPYYNDVVARPMVTRWYQRYSTSDAVYISWHTNGSSGDARGTVSYVHNEETYPRTDGSLQLQAAVHNELVHDIRAGWDPAWVDRGKGQLNLGELRMLWDPDYASARVPGVLLEIAFHDNYDDALALKDPGFNRLAARGVYQGIVAYFDGLDGHAGDLDLAPEPPTGLRVENAGSGTLRVSWHASPTDAVGLRGDAATAYHVYTSVDGFAWGAPVTVAGTETTLSGYTEGQTRYFRVTGINAGGESFPTEVLGARVGDAALLIVSAFDKLNRFGLVAEDDPVEGANLRMWTEQMNSFDYVVHHGQAVPADIPWDSSSNEAVIAGSVTLGTYGVVDWILGEETTTVDGTFSSTERALVAAYLAQNRALLVSGSEFAWELEDLGGDPDFLHTTLHTDYVADDAATYTTRPVTGGAFSGLGDLYFDAPGEYDVDFPDVLGPLGGGQTALTYVGGGYSGQAAAIQYASGCQRLLVLGFPFETLRADQRASVMAKAVAYLDACPKTAITNPQPYTASPVFNGTASGAGLTAVRLCLRRWDGTYWAGGIWTAAETWFTANGTALWDYTLLAMGDGSYTLRAKAVAPGAEDPSPAEASFVLDRVAPAVPAVITPTNGITLTGPTVRLLWTVVVDSGSPIHYRVEIDGRMTSAAAAPYVVTPSLGPGNHTWRVQAEDAAGNRGLWSPLEPFVVEVKQVFLPVVLQQ